MSKRTKGRRRTITVDELVWEQYIAQQTHRSETLDATPEAVQRVVEEMKKDAKAFANFQQFILAKYKHGEISPRMEIELEKHGALERWPAALPRKAAVNARQHEIKDKHLDRLLRRSRTRKRKRWVALLIDQDFEEAERQARKIRRLLNKRLEAEEKACLLWYASDLLLLYVNPRSNPCSIPYDLFWIFANLGHEDVRIPDKRPEARELAIRIVREQPDISQYALMKLCRVNLLTIRRWGPDLRREGWRGAQPQTPRKPKHPKRGTPYLG